MVLKGRVGGTIGATAKRVKPVRATVGGTIGATAKKKVCGRVGGTIGATAKRKATKVTR